MLVARIPEDFINEKTKLAGRAEDVVIIGKTLLLEGYFPRSNILHAGVLRGPPLCDDQDDFAMSA